MENDKVILVNEFDDMVGIMDKMKYINRACCIVLSAFLFSIGKGKCSCSKGHSVNIIAVVYGPTPAAVIPCQVKKQWMRRNED
jgi:hypothetical protein